MKSIALNLGAASSMRIIAALLVPAALAISVLYLLGCDLVTKVVSWCVGFL